MFEPTPPPRHGSGLSTSQWLSIVATGVVTALIVGVIAVLATRPAPDETTADPGRLVVPNSASGSVGFSNPAGSDPATVAAAPAGTDANPDNGTSAPTGDVTQTTVATQTVVKTAGPTTTSSPTHSSASSTATSSTATTTASNATTTATSTGTHVRVLPTTILTQIFSVAPTTRLNYSAPADFGEANVSAGFSPDPYSVGMSIKGPVNTNYLGSSCSGFTAPEPALRVNFGGGASSLLRFYFVGENGNPSIVINDPYGNYYCVNDSFGTLNPTIDFNNPAGGTYDVWIASASADTTINGTLYLTENSGNHP